MNFQEYIKENTTDVFNCKVKKIKLDTITKDDGITAKFSQYHVDNIGYILMFKLVKTMDFPIVNVISISGNKDIKNWYVQVTKKKIQNNLWHKSWLKFPEQEQELDLDFSTEYGDIHKRLGKMSSDDIQKMFDDGKISKSNIYPHLSLFAFKKMYKDGKFTIEDARQYLRFRRLPMAVLEK